VISSGPAYDFGTLATGTTTNHIFFVTNTGTATATTMASMLTAPFAYVGGNYPGASASCGATLPAGATCILNVSFTPSMTGTVMTTLTIAYNDGAQAAVASRTLSGKGTSQASLAVTDFPMQYYQQYGLQADPTTFAFGSHGLGSTTTHTFYLTNMGAAPATGLGGGALSAPFSYLGSTFPGAGGTCNGTVAPGDNCTVVVAFAPTGTTPSTATATMAIVYDDGTAPAIASRPLSGSGTTAPQLVVQDFEITNLLPNVWDFGSRGINQSTTHEFWVLNTGGAYAGFITAPAIGTGFSYVGGFFPGQGGSCTMSLAPGAACSINVEFKPTTAGPAIGTVRINYQDGLGMPYTSTRLVRGVGTTVGLVEIGEKSDHGDGLVTDFGAVGLGSNAQRVFEVRNIGGGPVSAINFAAPAAPFAWSGSSGAFPGTNGTCGLTLNAGATCTVDVTFKPTVVGDVSALLSLTYSDGTATQGASRSLVGEGIDGARLTITDWSGGGNNGGGAFDFGTWGVATSHTFYVWNSGNKAASSLAGAAFAAPFSWAGGGSFPGAGGTCNGTLAVGASCSVVVTFSGAATGGGKVTLTYADGAGNNAQATRDVIGARATNALLVVSDCDGCGSDSRPADFGTVGTSATRWFTVRNNGALTAAMVRDAGTLTGPFAFAGGGGYPGANGTCSNTLAPGMSCQVTVTFTPTGPGSFAGSLGIAYDDGTGVSATATRSLAGSQTNLALLKVHDWSETDTGGGEFYDLGVVGVAVDHTFTITNDGAQPATMMVDGGGLDNGFSWKGTGYPGTNGTCMNMLAPGAHCTVVVRFTPSGSGYRSSQLLIRYHDGANTQYAKRSLSATATDRALLQITDWTNSPPNNDSNQPPFDYGVAGTAREHTFIITNRGAVPATMMTDGGTLGNGFGWTNNGTFGGGTCGSMLAAGATCTVSVTFTPMGDAARTSTLSVSYNDGANTQVVARALTATATTKAMLNIYDWNGQNGPESSGGNGPPYDFGVWGVPVDHEFTVRNDGGGPATMMGSAGAMGTGFGWKNVNYPGSIGGDCGGMLAVGATCKLMVTFTPSGSATLFGQVRVAYNDGGATRTAIRAISGTPTARAHVTVAEFFGPNNCSDCSPFDFGATAVGTSNEHTFTVYNTGALPATAMSASGPSTPFAYKAPGGYPGSGGDCSGMLAAGAWCQLVVVFTPQAAGTASSTLGISYNDTFMSPLLATRAISGTGF